MKSFPPGHRAVNFYCSGLQEQKLTWEEQKFEAGRAVNFYCSGLQEQKFAAGRYDCIWIQWCLLYLTDDSSLTRSNAYMLELFEKSNTTLLLNTKQKNFPKGLFEEEVEEVDGCIILVPSGSTCADRLEISPRYLCWQPQLSR
eukprot:gene10704-12405_t